MRTSLPAGAWSPIAAVSSRTRSSDWLNPRARRRSGCSGTATADEAASPSTTNRSASSNASGLARRRQPRYLNRWMASSIGPSYATREHEPRLRGVVKPAFTSADEDLIAGLQTEGRGRPGGQLDHALCAPDEPHHSPPCVQVRIDLLHAFLAVKENCVDRKSHQDHGDAAPLARVDPHPTSWLQGAAEHEADGSAEDGAGNHEVFGQRFAATFMHGSRTRHLNGVA